MMMQAQNMVRDFPDFVQEDIEKGDFEKQLRDYCQKQSENSQKSDQL